MRNTLLLLLVAALLPLSASAQDVQSSWEFDMIFPNDSAHVVNVSFGTHGLEVDNDGKVWVQSNNPRVVPDDETARIQIRVFNEDGSEVDFSPIWNTTIGDSTYIFPAGRGMRLDHEGNILAAFGHLLFRIDAETGEGMNVLDLTPIAPIVAPGVDGDGNIVISSVLPDNPVQIYASDMATFIMNAAEDRPAFARSMEFSADGNTIYMPNVGEIGGRVITYQSEAGVVGTFLPQEPIVRGVHGETIAISRYDNILWVSSGNPSDGINTDEGEDIDTDWEYGYWYGFDQETGELVDWILWENQDVHAVRPRGTAFSPDGQYAYLANFESQGAGVQRFRRIETSIEQDNDIIPQSFELDQNYPNPFNPTTSIQFTVREAGQVSLRVYDMLGREVATLQEGALAPGQYTATFDANHLASGTYLYVLEAGGQRMTRSMVLLK